ncbi:DEAD/DEAH box helicase [Gleimia hominis]|uniref:DEAD/DEAH box helicase n=1 Tax=Gleimia hominis TaxID=595468 RepID=A0ABU3I9S1_9ACTO|nr:DEAD/DEAH box helicase [Gleimia hominis]MDT3766953.1 DEAD/DEAH box helicase [Gleimia hominis]
MNAVELPDWKRITRYMMSALEADRLDPISYSSNSPYNRVNPEEIRAGRLNLQTTRHLFQSARKKLTANTPSGRQTFVRIVISTRSVQWIPGGDIDGIINLPANVTRDGSLSFAINDDRPWVPLKFLQTPHAESGSVTAGHLHLYRKFEFGRGRELTSQNTGGNWQRYLALAGEMFDSIRGEDDPHPSDQLKDTSHKYIADVCYVKCYEGLYVNADLVKQYSLILENKEGSLYRNVLQSLGADNKKVVSESSEEDLRDRQRVSGSMSKRFSLAPSQRVAVHAQRKSEAGELVAVSGPPGTGKTTMLQSVVASTIVDHALRGEKAPLIVGTSTNNQAVTNIIDSFSSVSPDDPQKFEQRWLLKVDSAGSLTGEVMSSIVAACPSEIKKKEYENKGYITEERRKTGVYSRYSTPEYVAAAKEFFLKQAEKCGFSASSLPEVSKSLRQKLVEIDQCRREALGLSFSLGAHVLDDDLAQLQANCEGLVRERDRLYHDQDVSENRLNHWEELRSTLSTNRILRTLGSRKERRIIADNTDPDKKLEQNAGRIDTIITRYRKAVAYQSTTVQACEESLMQWAVEHIQRTKGLTNDKEWLENQLSIVLEKISSIYDSLLPSNSEGLSAQEIYEQANALQGDYVKLDELFDKTVRYLEFWLAIHYYESRWLQTCDPKELLTNDDKFKNTRPVQTKYWSQVTAITPCFVMTQYKLPSFFTLFVGGSPKEVVDADRIDLLIVDEAGQVSTPAALPALACAKKAIAVGDTQQLPPVWGLDNEADKAIARYNGISDGQWEELLHKYGVSASSRSSFMELAMNVSKWLPSDYAKTGQNSLLLREHYRCAREIIEFCNDLVYDGQLIPLTKRSNVLPESTVPLQFKLVEHSTDTRVAGSRKNEIEATEVARWIARNRHELLQLYGVNNPDVTLGSILAVIAPFRAQAETIKAKLRRVLIEEGMEEKQVWKLTSGITISTVHSLQGSERPIILFSATYGSQSYSRTFINANPDLMNVAVSRAKDLFIVFGSEAVKADDGSVLKPLIEYAQTLEKTFGEVSENDSSTATACQVEKSMMLEETSKAWVDDVDRERYLSMTLLLKEMVEQEVIPAGPPSVQAINKILVNNRLIEKQYYEPFDEDVWVPTDVGFLLGIREVRGGRGADEYVNVVYPRVFSAVVAEIVRDLKG